MLDIRYHIASLTAVFLALGFGILIGSSFAGPAAIHQMSYQIQKQNARLDTVMQQNAQDHAFLKQDEDAISGLVPHLVQNRLAGKRVALIQTGDYPDAVKDASDSIAQAGGAVVSTITLTGRFDMLSDDERAGLIKSLGGPLPDTQDDSALLRPLALGIREGTASHANLESQLATLEQAGLIVRTGDFSQPVEMVVLLGGTATGPDDGEDSPPDPGEELVALFRGSGDAASKPPIIVGCETRDAVLSSVPAYLRAGIASVDCIDLPLGALDLPFALSGESSAYGVKPSADREIPQSLEPAPAPA